MPTNQAGKLTKCAEMLCEYLCYVIHFIYVQDDHMIKWMPSGDVTYICINNIHVESNIKYLQLCNSIHVRTCKWQTPPPQK